MQYKEGYCNKIDIGIYREKATNGNHGKIDTRGI